MENIENNKNNQNEQSTSSREMIYDIVQEVGENPYIAKVSQCNQGIPYHEATVMYGDIIEWMRRKRIDCNPVYVSNPIIRGGRNSELFGNKRNFVDYLYKDKSKPIDEQSEECIKYLHQSLNEKEGKDGDKTCHTVMFIHDWNFQKYGKTEDGVLWIPEYKIMRELVDAGLAS